MVLPLLGVAVAGLSIHYCLTNAFRYGDAMIVIPMDFLRVPLIAMIGWMFYGEHLDAFVFAGAGLIIAGVLWNVRGEAQRNGERRAQPSPARRIRDPARRIGCSDQSQFGAQPTLTTRPAGLASASTSAMSAADSSKSKIDMFSVRRSTFEVRGITIAPFCTSQRSDTWPAVLPYFLPTRVSTSSPTARPRAIGQ